MSVCIAPIDEDALCQTLGELNKQGLTWNHSSHPPLLVNEPDVVLGDAAVTAQLLSTFKRPRFDSDGLMLIDAPQPFELFLESTCGEFTKTIRVYPDASLLRSDWIYRRFAKSVLPCEQGERASQYDQVEHELVSSLKFAHELQDKVLAGESFRFDFKMHRELLKELKCFKDSAYSNTENKENFYVDTTYTPFDLKIKDGKPVIEIAKGFSASPNSESPG